MATKKKTADTTKTKKKAAPAKETKKKAVPKKEEALTKDYITGIIDYIDEMKADLEKSLLNASAARRARKTTIELTKKLKEYRANSIEHHKK